MKMLGIGAFVLFVGFWMVQSPDSLAQFAGDGAAWTWTMTETVFSSVIDFLGAVFD